MVFSRSFFIFFFLIFLTLSSLPGSATEIVGTNSAKSSCEVKESANINVSFSGSGESPDKIKKMIDAKITELKTLAKEKGAKKFEIQNTNLNFNPAGDSISNTSYSYNSSYSFVVEPANVAFTILETAQTQGWRMGMNMASYRQCP